MQESQTRLHGWRRRGRMAIGEGGEVAEEVVVWGEKEGGMGGLMRNSCPRMEGSGFRGGAHFAILLHSGPWLCCWRPQGAQGKGGGLL